MTSGSLVRTGARRLTTAGLLLALGLVLPFFTSHALGLPGTVLLPMHLPVLLGGFLCGPVAGLALGAVLPILNCLLTGMPALYPMVPIMTAELAAYGAIGGLLYVKTPLFKYRLGVYPALLGAMLAGRVLYGAVFYLLLLGNSELRAASVGVAVVTGLPGIAIQLVLVPLLVRVLNRKGGATE